MGYRADYFITSSVYVKTLGDDIQEESGYSVDDNSDPDHGNDVHIYSAGWDNFEGDMIEISIQHKDVLLTVEENGDEDTFHRSYFKNGKCLHSPGKIVYETVDLTLLD